ncbi:MAG TPA: zf-HC2 domain-containing protein [Polyangia bacterium]|jgi:anti-sigma factor RsiW|nr:zf-HC2 domain-containing protein [Polyangia bacterium]
MDATTTDLVCRELVELASDYLSDTLPASERARFEQHLETCPPCTSYLAQMKVTLALAGELDAPSAQQHVERELADLFRSWHKK